MHVKKTTDTSTCSRQVCGGARPFSITPGRDGGACSCGTLFSAAGLRLRQQLCIMHGVVLETDWGMDKTRRKSQDLLLRVRCDSTRKLAAKAPQSPALSPQEGPQAACSRGKRPRASSLARPYVIVLMEEPGDASSQLLQFWKEKRDEQVHRDCFQRHGTQS